MSTDNEQKRSKTTIRSDYMRDYYRENKQRILDQRKRRYQNDHEYREKLNNSRRKTRVLMSEPQKIQSVGLNTEEEREVEVAHLCLMRVLNPKDRGLSVVCKMYSMSGAALMCGVEKDKLLHWLYKDKLPQPRYRSASNWRLYTEYEVAILKRYFKMHRTWCRANNYAFRMNKDLSDKIQNKFDELLGGVDPKDYEAHNDL